MGAGRLVPLHLGKWFEKVLECSWEKQVISHNKSKSFTCGLFSITIWGFSPMVNLRSWHYARMKVLIMMMKMIKVNFRRPLVRRKHLICSGDNLMRWSWSGNSHRLMLIIWEMSALYFFWRNSDLMAMISLIWIFSVFWWWWWEWEWWLWKPPEVGSRPLLLFSIEDLVGERETGRDFKNHLVYRHLLVLVIIWTFF